MSSDAATYVKCKWCGMVHDIKCPAVKAFEYYPDGRIRRIEFFNFAEMFPQAAEQKQQPQDMLTKGNA